MQDVAWCVLVEVKGAGANIVRHTGDTSSFQYISNWMQAEQMDVNLTQISTDFKTLYVSLSVKGENYYNLFRFN